MPSQVVKLLFLSLPIIASAEDQSLQTVPTTIQESHPDDNLSSPSFEIRPQSLRVRHRLEGLDNHWTEVPDEMNVIVYFIRNQGQDLERISFPATGTNSPENVELSRPIFTSRKEFIPIPPDTEKVQVVLTSSGSPAAIGFYTIKNLILTASKGGTSKIILENGVSPDWPDALWSQSGTRPSLAREGVDFPNELTIVDTDLSAHADWAISPFPIVGDQLVLEWEESYHIAKGGPRSIVYERLPPGKYRFQVEELGVAGELLGTRSEVEWVVPRPAWQTWWFWLVCLGAIALVILLLVRSTVNRRVRRAVRHTRLIENERLRIAMDLHDDIGTRLSQISLIGSHARMKTDDTQSRESFANITQLTGELASGLSETVWMLSPKNNDLESLVGFLCRLASELCRVGEMRCRIDAEIIDDEIPISQEFRHHFVLSVKEALNNALKHSQGNEIRLTIQRSDGQLIIWVDDDGTGLDHTAPRHGNGLSSLKQRMLDLKGSFMLKPSPSGGLRISLKAPLKQNEF